MRRRNRRSGLYPDNLTALQATHAFKGGKADLPVWLSKTKPSKARSFNNLHQARLHAANVEADTAYAAALAERARLKGQPVVVPAVAPAPLVTIRRRRQARARGVKRLTIYIRPKRSTWRTTISRAALQRGAHSSITSRADHAGRRGWWSRQYSASNR